MLSLPLSRPLSGFGCPHQLEAFLMRPPEYPLFGLPLSFSRLPLLTFAPEVFPRLDCGLRFPVTFHSCCFSQLQRFRFQTVPCLWLPVARYQVGWFLLQRCGLLWFYPPAGLTLLPKCTLLFLHPQFSCLPCGYGTSGFLFPTPWGASLRVTLTISAF